MVRIGVALPHYDFSLPDGRAIDVEAIVEWARTIEALGFDSVWISDHLFLDLARYGGPAEPRYHTPEAMTVLAALARETQRVRLGALVLCAAFRNPVMLANEVATVDLASNGRFELGLGAGWHEAEFDMLGIPFGTPGERIAALDEYLQIVRPLLRGETVGTAQIRPAPAHDVPIWVGAKGGPRMLRLIAERADGWNVVWRMEPDAYARRLSVLHDACTNVGRDPGEVHRSVGLITLIGRNAEDLAARLRAAQQWQPGIPLDREQLARECLVGTVDECIERIRAFEALGVEEIICSFAPLPFAISDPQMPQIFAEHVIPAVR
jgi:alkanesulfonate monooxygenase SsuD/methylene tetrahydromethanopterin reductase-like flavin-dependent oxidoreductase (luciferase family)